ncbi:sigma factor-like helix-turn-helix DNA-binding protein [Nocardioides sp.]|uniref:sigma factor-like helix-turn-helix DNA-binding protein n=1 Tax=Nocardioides sp. TaxID=35761 RepID=UPI002ED8E27C
MRDPDQFDEFYKDVRNRLLLLTYCLTGDLSASRAAVRDAFVVTAHHWRKVRRLEDPEASVRVRACAHAQRRHTAKLWHREKGLDPEVKATLDALGKLPPAQRKVLLLTELTTASLAEIAREVGLPRTDAERELQSATAQLSVLREVPTTSIRTLFDPIRAHVEASRWPRAPIIRRAGSARRRTHTVIGIATTVAALVVTGTLVTDADGVRPTLAGERVEPRPSHKPQPSSSPTPDPVEVPESSLLSAEQIGARVPGTGWAIARTDENTEGDGLVMPCQTSRYADPRSTDAMVRTFTSSAGKATEAVQATQASATPKAAGRGYRTAVGWFAGCADERAQLLETREVRGVGDEATLLVLRTWDKPRSTLVAGVARTGLLTTTVLTRSPVGRAPELTRSAQLLENAVDGLCGRTGAGACTTVPRLRRMPPVPVAVVPGMLAEVDLAPVGDVRRPWVGTEPRQARTNAAATSCDQTDFKAPVSNSATRTFLIPGAKLRAEFGLTETVGTLPERKAAGFVDAVRDRLRRCSDKRIGTTVDRIRQDAGKHRDLTIWRVTTEVSDNRSVSFLMGIVRDGTALAQIGFVPDPAAGMSAAAFEALVERALARLGAMPAPAAG